MTLTIQFRDPYLRDLSREQEIVLVRLLDDWGRNYDIFLKQIERWFANFEDADKPLAFKLLTHINYYSQRSIEAVLEDRFKLLMRTLQVDDVSDIFIVLPDDKTDSGNLYSYNISKIWSLLDERFLSLHELTPGAVSESHLIFFNDTHGSGKQFMREVWPRVSKLPSKSKLVVAITLCHEACERFAAVPGLEVLKSSIERPTTAFLSRDEHDRVRELGEKVFPAHPLGFGGCDILVAYHFQCPNNTIPLIWADGENNLVEGKAIPWNPLFRYRPKVKYRDFSYSISRHKPHSTVLAAEVQETVESTRKEGNSLIRLGTLIVNSLLTERIVDIAKKSDRRTSEAILFQTLNREKELYAKIGDPALLYNALSPLAAELDPVLELESLQLANIHLFLGYLLINGNHGPYELEVAKRHLIMSKKSFEQLPQFSAEVIINLVRSSWLHAVATKLEGDPVAAAKEIEDAKINYGDVARPEDLLPIERQQAILHRDFDAFYNLYKIGRDSGTSPIEMFHTTHRCAEYFLDNKNPLEAEKYLSEANKYLTMCSDRIDKIYICSYYKNVFTKNILMNNAEAAEVNFRKAYKMANDLKFFGQLRQLRELARNFGLCRLLRTPTVN